MFRACRGLLQDLEEVSPGGVKGAEEEQEREFVLSKHLVHLYTCRRVALNNQ